MKIRIITIGKLKEPYWRAAEQEYLKRLNPYSKIEVIECNDLPSKENASLKEEEEIKLKEGREVLAKLKPSDFLVLLDLGKEEMTSPELAKKFSKWMELSGSNLTFVIGGSLGLSQELRNRGNATLTLSSLTFTHQMTRIILLEQIYRSFKILKNEPYHK